MLHSVLIAGRVAKPLSEKSLRAKRLVVKAPGPTTAGFAPNDTSVVLGGPKVEANASERGGLPIGPGETVELNGVDLSEVHAVSSTDDQALFWAVTE